MIVKGCRHDEKQSCTRVKLASRTVWPSGLRHWLQVPVRKGVGSNPTVVAFFPA